MTPVSVSMTLADAGYFAGKHLEEIHQRGQQVPDLARPTNHPYHKDQFVYDEENDSYTCPHGQRPVSSGLKYKRNRARVYRIASASICRDCLAFGVCTTNTSYGRSVEIGIHEAAPL